MSTKQSSLPKHKAASPLKGANNLALGREHALPTYFRKHLQNNFFLAFFNQLQQNKTVLKILIVHPHVPKKQACLQKLYTSRINFQSLCLGKGNKNMNSQIQFLLLSMC